MNPGTNPGEMPFFLRAPWGVVLILAVIWCAGGFALALAEGRTPVFANAGTAVNLLATLVIAIMWRRRAAHLRKWGR